MMVHHFVVDSQQRLPKHASGGPLTLSPITLFFKKSMFDNVFKEKLSLMIKLKKHYQNHKCCLKNYLTGD